jgi:protein tyrosine phosphatase (PTP) superfamily phosphohydrolase (DUF442 family)
MRQAFRRPTTRFAALLLLASAAVGGTTTAAAAAPPAGAPVPPPPVTIAGVTAPNVVQVSPLLVTAGQPTRESLQGLEANGYDAVIYLAPGDSADAIPEEAALLKAQGIEFVHVPIPWNAPETKHLTATADAMKRLQGKKVLVHCQLNMRASAITFLYRTIYAKEDPATAWLDVKKVWTPRDPWATFVTRELAANHIAFTPE